MGKWPIRGAYKGARRWRVRTLIRKYGGRCALCDVEVTLDNDAPDQATVDHIIPLSKGGDERLCNLQLLCRACNMAKGDTILAEDGEVAEN